MGNKGSKDGSAQTNETVEAPAVDAPAPSPGYYTMMKEGYGN